MISKVIGIISYFPDNMEVRNRRKAKLIDLIQTLNALFKLPIYIEAQSWTSQDVDQIQQYKNITIRRNEKPLGIVGARNALRNWFLESPFDYLIMIDDDSKVMGSSATAYLKQINEHPDGFGEFNKSLLKLFAISKTVFKEVAFDENCNPEKGEGFEDRLFVNTLRKKFPDQRFEFKDTGLSEYSISTADPDTTWYNHQDLTKMLKNTELKINS